jgi:glycosyltransferase involved in cell wall biosynthesis
MLKVAIIMSDEVGLKTQLMNWQSCFPSDMGIEPTWIIVNFWEKDGFLEKLPLPKSIISLLRGRIQVARGLKQERFDATISAVHSVLASQNSYLKNNACYSVFDVTPKQLHDFGEYYGKYPSRFSALEKIKHRQRSSFYRSCRLLFPWSEWAARSVVNDYGALAERVKPIPPGVDLSKWKPSPRNQAKTVCDILFVGGDFQRKGGGLLLDWAQKTKQKNWRLHIVTSRPIETALDSRIKIYTGLTSNSPMLIDLYNNADLFVLPTLADCYSIAGIEALASGLPIILSDSGGAAEVVTDGVTGQRVKAGDIDSLSKALDSLIGNVSVLAAMGTAARADALRRYDAAQNIRTLLGYVKESL